MCSRHSLSSLPPPYTQTSSWRREPVRFVSVLIRFLASFSVTLPFPFSRSDLSAFSVVFSVLPLFLSSFVPCDPCDDQLLLAVLHLVGSRRSVVGLLFSALNNSWITATHQKMHDSRCASSPFFFLDLSVTTLLTLYLVLFLFFSVLSSHVVQVVSPHFSFPHFFRF